MSIKKHNKQVQLPLSSAISGTANVGITTNNPLLFLTAGYNAFLPCRGQDGARSRWHGKGEVFFFFQIIQTNPDPSGMHPSLFFTTKSLNPRLTLGFKVETSY